MEKVRPEISGEEAAIEDEASGVDITTGRNHLCPYTGCFKSLPTWKGILNHCYLKHKWSGIRK